MVWAFGWRPRLIIPDRALEKPRRAPARTLLIHELAHLRRGDHRVRFFELVVTALYWWNPVLWWARQALRDVEEQCCDAWVVWALPDAAKSYAETLLETLDFLNQSDLSEPLLASGFGKVHHLRKRLTMIMSGTTPRLVSLWGTLGALSLGALLLPVNATWRRSPRKSKEIRVVVKTDDERDVDESAGTATTPTFGRTAPESCLLRQRQAGRRPDQKATVNVVVKTDDSSVSFAAGSVDEASTSSKPDQGDREKSRRPGTRRRRSETPSEQIARSSRNSEQERNATADEGQARRAKPEGSPPRFVRRRTSKLINAGKMSPEKKAEIEKARPRSVS